MQLKRSALGLIAFSLLTRPVACPAATAEELLPVRGFCIGAPGPKDVDEFVAFINKELGPRKVNVLILRVDYNYQYQSHPELAGRDALSKQDAQKLVAACKASQ